MLYLSDLFEITKTMFFFIYFAYMTIIVKVKNLPEEIYSFGM